MELSAALEKQKAVCFRRIEVLEATAKLILHDIIGDDNDAINSAFDQYYQKARELVPAK